MHYILDGNNIIKHRAWQNGNQKFDDRQALIIFLKNYSRHHPAVKFTVVFDGWSDLKETSGNIKIVWSKDISADEVIIKKIPALTQEYVVVSDDNQIRKMARFAKLRVLKVEEFINIIEPKKIKKQSDFDEKIIPYSRVPGIKKELEKYYEKHQETDRIRKIRKRIQGFF